MHTDLFLTLKDTKNPRGHPLLAALLYAFCPAAARWWLAGAEPVLVFDPVWQALTDRAGGGTLKEALAGYGFGALLEQAKSYVDQVAAARALHPNVPAPELLPTFRGGFMEIDNRFGQREAIQNFGGRWENFFLYVRTWAFLVSDWEGKLNFTGAPELAPRPLMLTLSGIRRPVRFPAWVWFDRVGKTVRIVIGLLVNRMEQDELRLALARQAGPEGEVPWPSPPEVRALDRESGQSEPCDSHLPPEELASTVDRLADLARGGPHPPLGALTSPGRCRSCGFSAQCYAEGQLSPLALGF